MNETTHQESDNQNTRPSEFPSQVLVKIAKSNPTVAIEELDQNGDVRFSVSLNDLDISGLVIERSAVFHTAFFADFTGELIVRKNIGQFAALLAQIPAATYDRVVGGFQYQHCGMQLENDGRVSFQFHVSLVPQILSEDFETVCQSLGGSTSSS